LSFRGFIFRVGSAQFPRCVRVQLQLLVGSMYVQPNKQMEKLGCNVRLGVHRFFCTNGLA